MDERVPSQNGDGQVAPRWFRRPELLLVIAVGLAAHLPRLSAIPVCGEESRWGTVARGMLETGDWLVPRQQGQVFPDRPPLGIWPMAAIATLRGEVDAVAIRLPSVIAVALTAVVVFAYASMFLSRVGAMLTAMLYPTMGHVLQLGSLGESDAQFTFYIASSLLIWHAGYMRKIPSQWVWASGYALAAAGALVKGLQAPVYFVAVTFIFLAVQRDWKYLLSWRHLVGMLSFVVVLGGWQLPYILATDLPTAASMWTNGPAKRFLWDGLLEHIATYPLETFACLLPWSPLLLMFASRRWRSTLGNERPYIAFLLTAIVVCYASLWFAATARGRYFMPLYPCVALLIGVVFDRLLVATADRWQQNVWKRYSRAMAVVAMLLGVAIVLASTGRFPRLAVVAQPAIIATLFGFIAITVTGVLIWAARESSAKSVVIATMGLIVLLVFGTKVVVTNATVAAANDLSATVSPLKTELRMSHALVSFGAINHRFDYYYGQPIEELPWPAATTEVPANIEYFCYLRQPGDTPECRTAGRVWNQYTTSGTLPFAWQEVEVVSMARRQADDSQAVVVVGRIVRRDGRIVANATGTVR